MSSWVGRLVSSILSYAKDPIGRGRGSAMPSKGFDLAGPITDSYTLGELTVQHVKTFQTLLNTFSKTYSFRYDEALRQDPEFALKLRRDAFLRALLQERLMPLTRWKWSLVPEDPEHKAQAERAKWYESAVQAQPHLSKKLLYLGHAAWYGRYGSQSAFCQDVIDGKPGWRVAKHKPVNGDKIVYSYVDDAPGIRISPMFASEYPRDDVTYDDRGSAILFLRRPEWRKKFVIHVHELDDADYSEGEMAGRVEGIGLRDFSYYGAFLRSELIKWAVSYMNKVGTLGLLIFRYPEGNAKAKADAERAAREASNRNALAIPVPKGADKDTASAELLPANMTGVQFLVDCISGWFERHVERLFVGQSMSAGEGSSGLGGGERAQFAENTKFNLLAFDAVGMQETLTQDEIVPLTELNGDAGWQLKWQFALPDPQAAEKLEAATKVANLPGKKITFKAQEVRDLVGLSEPGPGDEVVGGDDPATPAQPTGGLPAPAPASPTQTPSSSVSSGGDDVFDSLFGGGDGQQAQYAAADWEPHQLKSGPRKGQSVYRNRLTGEVRDKPPTDREAAEEQTGAKKSGREQPGGQQEHGEAQKHVRSLLSRVTDLPAAIKDKAIAFISNKYESLSARYGPNGAKAILAGMVLLTPIPLPGTSLLPIALAEGVKRIAGLVKGQQQPQATPTGPSAAPPQSGLHGTIDSLAQQAGISPAELSHEATNVLHEALASDKEPNKETPKEEPKPATPVSPEGRLLYQRLFEKDKFSDKELDVLGDYVPGRPKYSLQAMAVKLGLPQKGTKTDLASRIMKHAWDNNFKAPTDAVVKQSPIEATPAEKAWAEGASKRADRNRDFLTAEPNAGESARDFAFRHYPELSEIKGFDVEGHGINAASRQAIADAVEMLPQLKALSKRGVVYTVGDETVPGLDSMQHLKGQSPRGWPPGLTWDSVPGVFDPFNSRVVAGGGGSHGAASLFAHEAGHAIAAKYGLLRDSDTRQWHEKLHDNFPPYLQQGGPGGHAGVDEMIAESVAVYVKRGKEGLAKWCGVGDDYASWLDGHMRKISQEGEAS